MRLFLFFLFFLGVKASLFAQSFNDPSYKLLEEQAQKAYELGDYNQALSLHKAMLDVSKKAGIDSLTIANYLILANIYYKLDNLEQAEEPALQALALCAPGDTMATEPLMLLGILYDDMGDMDASEKYYQRALDLFPPEVQGKSDFYDRILCNLGTMYNSHGRNEEAVVLLEKSLAYRKKRYDKLSDNYSVVLNNLALTYLDLGKRAESQALILENLDISAELYGKQDPEYAFALMSMMSFYQAIGRVDLAEAAVREAVAILKKTLGESHNTYLVGLHNLSVMCLRNQKPEEALSLAKESLALRLRYFPVRHRETVRSYQNVATMYNRLQMPDSALVYAQRSLDANAGEGKTLEEIAVVENCIDKEILANAMGRMASAYYLKYQQQPNAENQAQWLRICDLTLTCCQVQSRSFAFDSDKGALTNYNGIFIDMGISQSQSFQERVPDLEEMVLKLAESGKSNYLSAALQNSQALRFGDLPDTLAQRESSLLEQIAEAKKQILEAPADTTKTRLQTRLTQLLQEQQLLLQQLAKDYPKYKQLKYEKADFSVSKLQTLLPPQTALLEYFIGDTVTTVSVLTAQKLKTHYLPLDKAEVTELIAQFRNHLVDYETLLKTPEKAFESYCQSSFAVYEALVQPALSGLSDIEQLIIVPDKDLSYIPFEALIEKKPSDNSLNFNNLAYLLHRYKMSYTFSAALWQENVQVDHRSKSDRVLAMSAIYSPDQPLDMRPIAMQQLRRNLQPLPSARQEVAFLREHFQGTFLDSTEATEAHFKAKAGEYGILHLAMHGLLHKRHPILSSLAFSEDGNPKEDNFLQSWEISQMQLSQAQLVVLSACETGYGKYEQGEGLMSLGRSFMYAGAPALLVSLWEVNDASTADIMSLFYTNMAEGMDKATALQQAKIQYLSDTKGVAAHPAFWSAFVQIGDSRPIQIAERGAYWGWIAGGLGLVAAIGVGGWMRRKRENGTS